MSGFDPFADDEAVWHEGSLCAENGRREVVVHGSVAFRLDRRSAERARRLAAFYEALAARIEGEPWLPEVDEPDAPDAVVLVDNPFA